MRSADLAVLNRERAARRPVALVTTLATGAQRVVLAADVPGDPLGSTIEQQFRLGRSGAVAVGDETYFLTVQVPPVHLVVVGAVHIAQALAPIAAAVDLGVTIVDPRTAFATAERFPDASVIAEWPDDVLPRLALDPFTAVALLTHDPKIDDPALVAALRADCFYIGALGSRKTHGKRIERMRERGFSEAHLARIHAPIGLDIGAVSPSEIAVAIAGEIIAARRRKPARAPSVAEA